MAYDRYDSRRDRDPSMRWRDEGRGGSGGERSDRGFFERAGDEIASWFGDDEAERRRRADSYDRGDGRAGWDQGRNERYGYGYGRQPERSQRDDGREQRWDRERPDSDRYSSSSRDYRPMTGDYGRHSGMGSQDFAREQYGRQDRFQDSDRHRGVGAGSAMIGEGNRQPRFAGHHSDPHYNDWRHRQMDELDRDYDDYRRENQSRFESEFTSWRNQRQSKRQLLQQIREDMTVVGSDGEHVGTVDKIRGDQVILTRKDSADHHHHSVNCSLIDSVEGDQVRLTQPAEQARRQFQREDDGADRGGLFGRRDETEARRDERGSSRDRDGPHILDRSFSGTYGNNGE